MDERMDAAYYKPDSKRDPFPVSQAQKGRIFDTLLTKVEEIQRQHHPQVMLASLGCDPTV